MKHNSAHLKIRATFLTIMMVVAMIAVGVGGLSGAVSATNDTLIVDGVGDANNEFETVSEADDAADSGDLIEVESGTYDEDQISIDTDGVTIESQGGAGVTTLNADFGIVINGDNVELSGFSINAVDDIVDNGAEPGVIVVNGDSTKITDNTINPAEDPAASGILIEQDDIDIVIRDNEISGVESGNSGGDIAIPDLDGTVELNDESFDAQDERDIANNLYRENEIPPADRDSGYIQIDNTEFETVLGVNLGVGGTVSSGGDPSETTKHLNVETEEFIDVDFGGDVGIGFELRHPASGDSVQIEPKSGEPVVETSSIQLSNLYRGSGEFVEDSDADSPAFRIDDEIIAVDIDGDEGILTDRDSTFNEFEVYLLQDGEVVDTSDTVEIGVAYEGDVEIDGPDEDQEATITYPRDDEVNEDWYVELTSSPRPDDVDTDITKEVDNNADDDFFEATVDVSDLEEAPYNVFFDAYESEQAAEDNERPIFTGFSVGGLEIIDDTNFQIDDVDIDDDNVVAGADDLDVNVTITNIAEDEDGEQDVNLLVGDIAGPDEVVDNQTLALDGGETEEITLTYETEEGDAPGVSVDIETDTDVNRGFTAAIESGIAEFQINDVSVDGAGDISQGDNIDLEAEVENTGAVEEDVEVKFDFTRDFEFDNGDSTEISVGAGETETAIVSGTVEQEPRAGEHPAFVEAEITSTDGLIGVPNVNGTGISVDYKDIESGVDAAIAGDNIDDREQVLVTEGTYEENVKIDTENVLISGIESGVEIEPEDDSEPAVTLTEDGTGVVNADFNEGDTAEAIAVEGTDTVVALSLIHNQFSTAVEVSDGATGAELIGNDIRVAGMNPVVNIEATDVTVSTNLFHPKDGDSAGDAIVLDDRASNTLIRDNTILTTRLDNDGGDLDDEAAIHVEDDASLEDTEILRNNFYAPNDKLTVDGQNDIDIRVNPDDPDNELDAENNYAEGGVLTLASDGINVEGTRDEPLEAELDVSIDVDPDEDITPEDEINITATVENTGDQATSETAIFEADDEEIGSGDVSDIEPDEEQNVGVSFTPDSDNEGEDVTLSVEVADSSDSETISVSEPAFLAAATLEFDEIEGEVKDGDEITALTDVENLGGVESAEQTIEIRIGKNIRGEEGEDYVQLASNELQLDSGEEQQIEFTDLLIDADDDGIDIGVNEIGVGTDDDDLDVGDGTITTITIEEDENGDDGDNGDNGDNGDDGDDDSGTTGSSGSSGTASTTDDDTIADDTTDDDTTTIADVDETVSEADPDTESEIAVDVTADTADEDGVAIDTSEETESVDEVTVREGVESVSIEEYTDEEVLDTTAESITESLSEDVTDEVGDEITDDTVDTTDNELSDEVSVRVITVSRISTEGDEDGLSQVTMSADPNDINNPERTSIFREADGDWEELETNLIDESNEEMIFEGQTNGNSLFAITEVATSDEEDQEQELIEEEEPEETDDSIPGFGVVVAIIATIALAMLARRKQAK